MFFRLKATGPYQYLQIAESQRQDGKVRQRGGGGTMGSSLNK